MNTTQRHKVIDAVYELHNDNEALRMALLRIQSLIGGNFSGLIGTINTIARDATREYDKINAEWVSLENEIHLLY